MFHTFPAQHSASIHGDNFVSFTDLCVSLTKHSHRVVFIGHLKRRCDWVDLVPPPRSYRNLSIALTSCHDSLIPMQPAIDIVWRWPCLPRLRLLCPLQLRCAWWSLRPGWLLNLSLTGTYVWTFLLWTLAVPSDWVDLPSPSSHFQDSVSCLTCSQDSQLLRHPAIDIVWRWPCLPCFRLLQTPCFCGVLGGL